MLNLHLLTLLEDFSVSDGVSLWVDVVLVLLVSPFLLPELEHVLSEVLTTDGHLSSGMRNSESLVDGDSVGNTIARVNHSSRSPSCSKKTHHRLISQVELGHLELFEK